MKGCYKNNQKLKHLLLPNLKVYFKLIMIYTCLKILMEYKIFVECLQLRNETYVKHHFYRQNIFIYECFGIQANYL